MSERTQTAVLNETLRIPLLLAMLGPVPVGCNLVEDHISSLQADSDTFTAAASADRKCGNGELKHKSPKNGTVCCPEGCGQCGGSGCGSQELGGENCCSGSIKNKGITCDDGRDAPCCLSGINDNGKPCVNDCDCKSLECRLVVNDEKRCLNTCVRQKNCKEGIRCYDNSHCASGNCKKTPNGPNGGEGWCTEPK